MPRTTGDASSTTPHFASSSDSDGAATAVAPGLSSSVAVSASDRGLLLDRVAEGIERRVGRQRFAVWFCKSVRLGLGRPGETDTLEVVVANDFVCDWIRRHFDAAVREAACETFNATADVRYDVRAGVFEDDFDQPNLFKLTPTASPTGGATPEPAASQETASATGLGIPAVTNAEFRRKPAAAARASAGRLDAETDKLRYDLDSFLIGANNQVAAECARSVSESPGALYNPLFIHGGVGLGKTHLLQGLCRRYAALHPAGRWAYYTAEEFTNGFVAALRGNRVDSFRRKLRDVDLLVIDDVHFLGGKNATQEEFLHTFNAIEAAGRHVVMASDAHPKTIASFGESLVSRFVSGMVARIDPPSREMRCQLLDQLAQRQGLKLDAEVIDWIARRVTQNVRELEGAINRMNAHVTLANRKADVLLAQEVLGDLDRQMNQPVRAEQVFTAACELFGLERSDLMSGSRQRTISLARSMAMYLTRKLTSLSYPEIASRMGKRNHSTVISACRRIEASIKKNETVVWSTSTGERGEPAGDVAQRLEDLARAAVVD
jgi:chromosomal replication initiator protein